MKIELKNIKIHPDMSEETTCFSATLYVNRKKAATCRNDGRGGSTDVYFEDRELMFSVFEWCKENPMTVWYGKNEYIFDSLEARIDELIAEAKFRKDFKRMQRNHLILRKKNAKEPEYVFHMTFKLRNKVDTLIAFENSRQALKNSIKVAQSKGYEIMNKNIDFNLLGL